MDSLTCLVISAWPQVLDRLVYFYMIVEVFQKRKSRNCTAKSFDTQLRNHTHTHTHTHTKLLQHSIGKADLPDQIQ